MNVEHSSETRSCIEKLLAMNQGQTSQSLLLSVTKKVPPGRAVVQADRCWILTVKTRVQSGVTSSKIRDGRSGTETRFFPTSWGYDK
jgi:hypothetical protein